MRAKTIRFFTIALLFLGLLSSCSAPATTVSPVLTNSTSTSRPTLTSTYLPTSTINITPSITPPATQIPLPQGAIYWYDVKSHGNKYYGTVCGLIVDGAYASSSNGTPTFLNLGNKYPDPDRFEIVIWKENLPKFPPHPEQFYIGKFICVSGLVSEYKGVPEVFISEKNQITILR